MNEDRLAEQIGRAQRASELLNDGLLAEAIKGIQGEVMQRMLATNDDAELRRGRDLVNVLDVVQARISSWVANGKLSRQELDDLVSGTRRKQFGIV